MSNAHAEKIEAQLNAEVQERLALEEVADTSATPDGVKLPNEIKRREDRPLVLAHAKATIDALAEREQAEYPAERAAGEEPRVLSPQMGEVRTCANPPQPAPGMSAFQGSPEHYS